MFTQGRFMGYYWGVGSFLSKHPNGGIPGGFFINGETNSIWVWDFLNKKWIDSNRVEGALQGIIDDPNLFEPNPKKGIKTTYLYVNQNAGTVIFTNFLNSGTSVTVTTESTSIIMLFWNGDYWETSIVPFYVDISEKADKNLSNVSDLDIIYKSFSEFNKRLYKTPILNWNISKTCPYAVDISDFIIDIRLTGDILGTSENPKYWAPLSVLTDIKTVMLYETDAEGKYLTTYNSISVSLKGDGLSYALNQEVKDKNGLTGKLSIVVDWTLWKHGKQEAMNPLRLNNDILKDHFGFISIIENQDVITDNVKPSYIKNVDSANILNWNNGVITQYHGKSGFTFTNSNAGNDGGIRTGNFTPDPNYHCIVDVNLKSITPSGNVTLYLYGTNGDVLLTYLNVPIGTTKLEFDPAYYTVYNNQNTFYLVLSVNGTAQTITVDVKDFICAQYPIGQTDNLTEIIKNLQSKISVLEGKVTTLQSTSDVTLISPNGSKYVLSITDDGNVTSIPIIPNKALFIGNSLLLGNGTFGMNATNNTKDYYDLIKEEFLSVGTGNYTSNKTSGTAFEDCESTTAGNAWLEDILKPQLSQDLDLVLIQLGDNVNTESKRTAFKTNAVNMLAVIKSIAKKARIAWVYGWYANSDVKASIQSACKTYGGIYIEINDLNTLENQSKIGEVITRTEVGNYNIHYDTVSDDSTGIDVTFTVDGKQYSSHIVAETYSFDDATKILTWTGFQSITTNSGVASHPGDLGFEKIADRILEGLKMKNYDTANYK